MKLMYSGKLYEAVQSQETEAKILNTVKNANSYDPNKPNKLYQVGGIVRDKVLGVASKDIDYLVTNVAFNDLKEALSKIADSIISTNVGDSMQVIKAVIDGSDEPYDFAIPRTEVYGGSGSHTDVKAFGDPSLPVETDLSRRDLTFNAIAYDVETGAYIDPFGGVNDIHNKVINAVGNPVERFTEDPLRILRAIQFANRFGFTIGPKTLEAIKQSAPMLDKITGERILEEFKKAFTKGTSKSNRTFVDLMIETGIGTHIFGEAFDPIIVDIIYGDKVLVNMILMFINGGDYEKLKPSTDIINAITLARRLVDQDALKVMYKNEKFYHIMKDAFKTIGDKKLIDKMNSLEGVPLVNKDLAVSSEYLMAKGYQGQKLGELQKAFINAIYHKEIANDEQELKSYLDKV